MKIKAEKASLIQSKSDLLAVNLFEGVKKPAGALAVVDKALGGVISKLIKSGEIEGKIGTCSILHPQGKIAAGKVAVVGLGELKDFNLEKVRIASAAVIKKAKEVKAGKVATIVHGCGCGELKVEQAAQALVEASIIGNYKFKGIKKKPAADFNPDELILLDIDPQKVSLFERVIPAAVLTAQAVNRARDLVNLPSNQATPTYLADYARKLAKQHKLTCEVLDLPQIKKIGLEALYSVAKGSQEPARLVVLKYRGRDKEIIGLVGKGITFDSGGISIKPARNLAEMKTDMAGAAAVLEVMRLVAQLKAKKSVVAVIPLAENMPDGAAYKPGDVISSLSGTRIEIISTDAEGRLILADAITYAKQLGASQILDVATLTGGCLIALGDAASGIMGNDQTLLEKLKAASALTGEKVWELPLFEEYAEYLKSENADLKNCAENGQASPSTGGTFLKEFVKATPWVHIDIAGTAYLKKERGYFSAGATGVMVRTLAKILL